MTQFLLLITLITADSKNPAFVLSDRKVQIEKKILYILGQKWCWGIIFLMMLCVIFFTAIATILIQVMKLGSPNIKGRSFWGAEEWQETNGNLSVLHLPIETIIISHTADKYESCSTNV